MLFDYGNEKRDKWELVLLEITEMHAWVNLKRIQASAFGRLVPNISGGEFGWGGTSVKMQHRCPKGSSERTETTRRAKGQKLPWFWLPVRVQKVKSRPIDPLSCHGKKFDDRGVRKVTKGITGLWRPSVHSDVAFWSFDVGSSYHWEAEFSKCWIVHPLTGNVSWVQTVVRQVSFTLQINLLWVTPIVIQVSTRGTLVSDNWCICFHESGVAWSYNPIGYSWTPLSWYHV